jgi:hypothetical protein
VNCARILLRGALAAVLGAAVGVNASAEQAQPAPKTANPAKLAPKKAEPPAELVKEPRALELLKAASDRLAAARSMSFTATVTYEFPSQLGPPIAYTTVSEVLLQRPDKLQVITPGDGPASEFYYDGKTIVEYVPGQDLVATAAAPPTIDGALKFAFDTAAIYFPFTDLIVSDPYKDLTDGLILAFYIGQSNTVGGTTTDMVAYATDEVFVQVWIGAEDKLPRRARAVYSADPQRLRHQLDITNWKLDAAVPPDAFASAKAAAAKPIPFAAPPAPPEPPKTAKKPAPAKKPASPPPAKPQ